MFRVRVTERWWVTTGTRTKEESQAEGDVNGSICGPWDLRGIHLGQSQPEGGDGDHPPELVKERGDVEATRSRSHLRAGTGRMSPLRCGEGKRKTRTRGFSRTNQLLQGTPRAASRHQPASGHLLVREDGGDWGDSLAPGRFQEERPAPCSERRSRG